jgi:hypothetical protein
MTIPHPMSTPSHTLPPAMDPYSGAYTLPPHSDLHLSRSQSYSSLGAPSVRTGGYPYMAPSLSPNYYGSTGLGSFVPTPALVPSGPTRYYGEHDSHPYSATH